MTELGLIVFMQGDTVSLNGKVIEQHAAVPGILGGNDVYSSQDLNGTRAHIGQIADGRSNDIERSGI